MALHMDVDGSRRARAEAARAGDPAALDAVAAEYLPLVYNIVRRALRRSADVDDVVQETMLRFVRGVASLRDPDRLRAWLVAVTVNQIREHHRSAEGEITAFEEAAEIPDPRSAFVETTLIQLDVSGQRRETQQAAQWLDPEQRELLALWWLEASGHLTRPELVEALRSDSHHVAVRVSRMKEQLEFARRIVRALSVTPRCPVLDGFAAGWRGETTSVWRKRFARHIRECAHCDRLTRGLVPPERLLVGLALLPLPAAYAAFRLSDLLNAQHFAHPVHPNAHVGFGHQTGGQGTGGHHLAGHGARHGGGAAHTGAKAGASFFAKPVGIAVAATLAVAVVAVGAIQLEPHHNNNVTLTTSQTNPAVPIGSQSAASIQASPTASASASPSKAASTSSKPSASPSPAASHTSHAPAPSTPASPPSTAPAGGGGGGSAGSYAAQQVLDIINQARAQAGLPAYTMSADLIKSASGHNSLMANGCGLSHQCNGEPSLGDRETAAGVQWTSAGENIGEGGPESDTQSAIAQMAESLTNSMLAEQPPNDGHRQNILSSSFTEVGIAVTRDSSGTVWMTQDFAN